MPLSVMISQASQGLQLSVLKLVLEPALLLSADGSVILSCNELFAKSFNLTEAEQAECSQLSRACGSHKTVSETFAYNILLTEAERADCLAQQVLCLLTVTTVLDPHDQFLLATARNICELDLHTLSNVVKEEPFASCCALSHVPFGISELNRAGTTSTWIYLSPAARQLVSGPGRPGMPALLREAARQWWISEMVSLELQGGFARVVDGHKRFPDLQASAVTLKRIANGPTGLPRFFWLADSDLTHEVQ
jgi:hypothetical protein